MCQNKTPKYDTMFKLKVERVIYNQVLADQGEWDQLVGAIEAAGIVVKNWLTVRSVLQGMINDGLVVRDYSDMQIELYNAA